MSNVPLKIIQISDTHLLEDENGTLLGVNTQESFQSVIHLLQTRNDKFDLILLTGDLTQDGSLSAYLRIAKTIKALNVPVYYVPGNHDNVKIISQLYPTETISNDRHIVLKNWQLILLDSQKQGISAGYLSAKELEFLQHSLQSYPKHHSIIVLHHQPVAVGSRWLDNLGLSNADEFWQVILRYSNVDAILFGHVHQEFQQTVNGVRCLSVPSTCIQFKRRQDHFGLEELPPGYRFLHLYEDGCIETNVIRGDKYIGVFEDNAEGY